MVLERHPVHERIHLATHMPPWLHGLMTHHAHVLMLDIDGVLNSTPFQRRLRTTTPEVDRALLEELLAWHVRFAEEAAVQPLDEERMRRAVHSFEPHLIARLSRLVRSCPGLSVILSSTWGRLMPLAMVQRILDLQGAQVTLAGLTPKKRMRNDHRYEILHWIEAQAQRPERIVVLDDDLLGWSFPEMVLVDSEVGLSEVQVDHAIACLQRPMSEAAQRALFRTHPLERDGF